MKTIAKMVAIYGVLVFLVVEFFNFLFKFGFFVLKFLVNSLGFVGSAFDDGLGIPLSPLNVILSMLIRAVAYGGLFFLVFLIIKVLAAGGAALGGLGAAAGAKFLPSLGKVGGKLGMSGIRGAGVKKGALSSGFKALGKLSGDDLRKAGVASNLLGARKAGRNLLRAGMARDGFDALKGAKAAKNKGKVAPALDKDGKPVEAAEKDKSKEAGADKDTLRSAEGDKDKKGLAGAAGAAGATMAAAGKGRGKDADGKPDEASELTDEEQKDENRRVAEGIRDANNLDETADGKKVPGAASRDRDLNVNRTHNEIKNATLNGSSSPIEPSSRTNSVDKNVDVGTDRDRLPVDADVADAHARKTGDKLKDLADSAPGQPVSEDDGEKAAEMRDKLVSRNADGQAVPSFAADDVIRSGEVLANSAAMHGSVVPHSVTDSGDMSVENIEAQTAEAHANYVAGAGGAAAVSSAGVLASQVLRSGQDPMTIVSDAPNPDDVTYGGYPAGTSQAALFAAAWSSGDHESFMQSVMAEQQARHVAEVSSPEAISAQMANQGFFSDGTPVPPEAPPEPEMVPVADPLEGYDSPSPEDQAWYDAYREQELRDADAAGRRPAPEPEFMSMEAFGAKMVDDYDLSPALAGLLGGVAGTLSMQDALGRRNRGADSGVSPQTLDAIERALQDRATGHRSEARERFMQEVSEVGGSDLPPGAYDEIGAKFDEALAEAMRRAEAEDEDRERGRQASDVRNRGKRKR